MPPDRRVVALPMPQRRPALNPMVLDHRMLLPVIDTNALLTEACYLVKHRRQRDKISALAGTGRANPHIAPHVPGEIEEHLPKLAAHYQVPAQEVRRLLNEQILPATRVVDLEIRDHLAPQTKHILRTYPQDARHRGDPDDAPTMALAEFLAPCVILTQDSVFSRFGFAVIDCIHVAQSFLRMAGLEATTVEALVLIDLVMHLLGAGVKELAGVAARHPVLSAAAVASALWFCHSRGYLRGTDWRQRLSQLWESAQPLLEQGQAAMLEHTSLRDSLIVVEAPAFPSVEQLAARYLARCGRPLTPSELRDALARRGHQVPAARLKREMSAHRAFVRTPGDLWTVGRPAAA